MSKSLIYITAGLLLVGALPMPYGYYMLLRIAATLVFAWAAFIAHEKSYEWLPWVYAILAILFNPIMPVYFQKELWVIIDILAAALLFLTQRHLVDDDKSTL